MVKAAQGGAVTFDDHGVSGEHGEWVDAIAGYIYFQKAQGMPPYAANQLGQHLASFFQFLPEFVKTDKCKLCDGRGHSNLIKLGAKAPEPCSDCKGSGRLPKPALVTE